MKSHFWTRPLLALTAHGMAFPGISLCVAMIFLLASAVAGKADVYLVDQGSGQLYDYASGTGKVLDNRLGLPNGLTLDAAGNIYVADNSNGTVYKYTPAGTQTVFESKINEKTFGMILDGTGNFYASVDDDNANEGSIIKITPAGVRSTVASGFSRPRGLAFDGAGNFYVADLDRGNVTKITPAGGQSTFAGPFNYPTGIAFDANGNLYVCSQGTAVYKVSPTGSVSTFTMNVTDPRWIAIDAAGNLFVTDVGDASGNTGQGSVYTFTPAGVRTTFATGLAAPLGIAVTGAASPLPTFFSDEVALANGVYYLAFPNGNYFGYYSFLSDPNYLYHFDLGYEYIFDAGDGKAGVYFYDFKSGGYFYTSPTFPFPYLYDFSLNTTLYYYPDPNNAGRYNTNGVRYFYNFATGKIITK